MEAVVRLAGTDGLDAALLGRELALLAAGCDEATCDGATERAAESLDRVGRGGAWHVAWTVAHTFMSVMLRSDHPTPTGLPALLAVAAAAAAGGRAGLPPSSVPGPVTG